MNITKCCFLMLILLFGSVAAGKLKLVAFKRPHFGFIGVKYRTPKLLGLKHAFGGLGHGLGLGGHKGFGGGGFHSSGYEHHEYHHESHHSGGSFGGGFGGGWLGK